MKIISSIRRKLILGIFLGCLVPYFIGGTYLKNFIENWLYNDNLEHSHQILEQVEALIDQSLITDIEEEVNLLASLDSVKRSRGQISNYLDLSQNNIGSQSFKIELEVEQYFKALKDSHDETHFIFLGTEDGDYMEFPRFSPSSDYDPRIRPWYINSINSSEIVISEPYQTNVTGDMVVSFTRSVMYQGQNVGVVGITVKLDDLTENINQIQVGDSGYIIVMSPNGRFIVSPKHPEWLLSSAGELKLDVFEQFLNQDHLITEAIIDGREKVINETTSPVSGWHIISIVDKADILQKVKEITNILIAIYVITLIVIFTIVYQISKRITKPILGIASVINRMADFDFNINDNSDIEKYSKRNDEVGVIASSLSDMHFNFIELMEQVKSIDNEIKTIDIESNTQIELKLSENNPFVGVTTSMNSLLAKVYDYLEKLKRSNSEVLEKNQLLTASEEELMAQIEEIDQQREYINFLAFHDPLTNLPNRRKFIDHLNYRINANLKGAVLLLDLDNFKGINDTLGHVFGDKVLESVARKLELSMDQNIFVSRFGGDEFLILIEYDESVSEINNYIKRISQIFDENIIIDDNEIEIRFSLGISLFPDDSVDVNQLIMHADLAMYAVKRLGKNGYKYFDVSMMDHQIKKSQIEILLRDAIENDGFKMVYQPQIEVVSGYIFGYEALLRMKNSTLSPAEFVEISEENGSIIKIGRIVTEKVIKQLSEWQKSGMKLKPVSINFSVHQLHDGRYLKFIREMLTKYDVEPQYLEIEITENIFLENKQATLSFLKQLKAMGIKIAIDDFGTGYSSLNYLTFLPVDKVKLDRSLNVKFLEIENIKVMDSLISLVHSLGLSVTAEGIETLDQVKRLKVGNCDYIQGYYFSEPVEADLVPQIHMKYYDQY